MSIFSKISQSLENIKVHLPNVTTGLRSLAAIGEEIAPIALVVNPAIGASIGEGVALLKGVADIVDQVNTVATTSTTLVDATISSGVSISTVSAGLSTILADVSTISSGLSNSTGIVGQVESFFGMKP